MSELDPNQPRPHVVVLLLVVTIHGVLLWAAVPLGFLSWVAAWPIMRLRHIRLGQWLGWIDINLIAGIERTILRPLIRAPIGWSPLSALPEVAHRIGISDFV